MENVEIKEEVKKVVKKKVVKKAEKADSHKVVFMKHMNEKREKIGLKPAYSKEEIEAYK
tara:strand:- start:586 stop:762 length:177 start_codon:yes stop_codon:yes gene_type:complete